MTTTLNFGRDVQGYNAYAPAPSTNNWTVTLLTGTATSIVVPSNFPLWIVAFSYQPGGSVFVDFSGATASAPVGNILIPSTSEYLPGARTLTAGTTISMISDSTTPQDVGIIMYAVSYS